MIERRMKFIAKDDERITSQVDGYGAGFSHVGIRAVAESMGWNQPGAVMFGTDNIESRTLKAWNGMPDVIGWLITVDVNL